MKNKYFFLFIILISISNVTAQDFKSELGAPFDKEYKKASYNLVFASPYGVTAYYNRPIENPMINKRNAIVIEKFDQALKKVSSEKYDLPILKDRAADLKEVIALKNQLIIVSTAMHKDEGKHKVYAQIYDNEKNTLSEAKELASFAIEKYSKSGFYQVAVSPNQSQIAILANMPFEKKTNEMVEVYVYDTNLNLMWQQKTTLDFESERAYQEELFVSDFGKVMLKKQLDFHKNSRSVQLITFDGNKTETVPFSQDDFFPMNTQLISTNGKSLLAGFYWSGSNPVIQVNDVKGQENDGVYLYDIDQKKLIAKHKWSEAIDSKGLNSLEIVDIKLDAKNIYIFGERRLTESEMSANPGMMTTDFSYTYTFGKSVLAVINTAGTLQKFYNLYGEKKYKNEGKEAGSFSPFILNNQIYTFSNNKGNTRLDNISSETNSVSILLPRIRQSYLDILPQSFTEVDNYNLMYYISSQYGKYYLTKITW